MDSRHGRPGEIRNCGSLCPMHRGNAGSLAWVHADECQLSQCDRCVCMRYGQRGSEALGMMNLFFFSRPLKLGQVHGAHMRPNAVIIRITCTT